MWLEMGNPRSARLAREKTGQPILEVRIATANGVHRFSRIVAEISPNSLVKTVEIAAKFAC